MSRLDQAIKLAVEVHEGQVDKGGNPYILHPLRVMCAVEKDLQTKSKDCKEDFLCAAILHDVLEDYDQNKYNIKKINSMLWDIVGRTVYLAVDSLTRKPMQTWKNYIDFVYYNYIARFVKIYDLEDNCDLTRLKEITQEDKNRNKMYIRAREYLETGQGKL